MLLETIVGVFSGLFGSALTSYTNYKLETLKAEEKKNDRAFQLDKIRAETDSAVRLAEVGVKTAQATYSGMVDVEEAKAFTKSQDNVVRRDLPSEWLTQLLNRTGWVRYITYPIGLTLIFLLGLSDVIKSFLPSLLTVYSVAIATYVYVRSEEILGIAKAADLQAQIALGIYKDAAGTLLMLMVTLVTWWFGDRRTAKNMAHMAKKES